MAPHLRRQHAYRRQAALCGRELQALRTGHPELRLRVDVVSSTDRNGSAGTAAVGPAERAPAIPAPIGTGQTAVEHAT